jgi:hypothetical protein
LAKYIPIDNFAKYILIDEKMMSQIIHLDVIELRDFNVLGVNAVQDFAKYIPIDEKYEITKLKYV